jgi:hypothetical protein
MLRHSRHLRFAGSVWLGFCLAACTSVHSTEGAAVEDTAQASLSGCELDSARIDALSACLDQPHPGVEQPLTLCLEETPTSVCDSDRDGLPDELEAALARAYAPVFAFNSGRSEGQAETNWPTTVASFLSQLQVVYRDGWWGEVVRSRATVGTKEALYWDGIGGAAVLEADGVHVASNPDLADGGNFWLCPRTEALDTVPSAERSIDTGIDLIVVVHPANGDLQNSGHIFISFTLFFAYNTHTWIDNHQGDWESIAVLVDRYTGAVAAVWYDRHATTDALRYLASENNLPVRNAATDEFQVNTSDEVSRGIRFWDYATKDGPPEPRHRVVAYVATGSHAMYDYPGNTNITMFGPRDTHDGDGLKLLTWAGEFRPQWDSPSDARAVQVNFVNPGEANVITVPWARYRGQWGCTNSFVGKSWPGPFGNQRHPRPLFEWVWGNPLAEPWLP